MHKFLSRACLAALALLLFDAAALAQNATGTIGGIVSDPTGARIPGATITATNVSTNFKHTAVSTAAGDFQLMQLAPGTYDLAVEATGFKTSQRKAIQVQVADRLTVNFSLEVGQVTDTVMVTGEVPLLRTEDAQVGQIIDSTMLTNLPQLDRNPLQLLRLSGNISGDGTMNSDTRINGGRSVGLEYLVDGASIMTGKGHNVKTTQIPDMETVGEFKVISNGMSAEYGRASGGLVQVATKSGTNELHGQGFEYFHNQLLNANSWEQNWSSPYVPGKKAERSVFHQNDYGILVGGPVYIPKLYNGKNRTFFLFDFEGFKKRTGAVNQLGAAPTAAERAGDLSGMLYAGVGVQMYDPLGNIVKDDSGNFIKTTPMGGDGKTIPLSRIDPAAARVLKLMALPNRTPTPGYSQYNGYIGQTKETLDRNSYNVRLDHNFTDKHHVYLRFNRMNYSDTHTQWFNALRPDKSEDFQGSITSTVAWDWIKSATTVVNVRASLLFHPRIETPVYDFDLANWELDPVMLRLENYMPNISFRTWSADPGWGGQNFLGGDQTFPGLDNSSNATLAVSVSKIYGRHTIKTGAETHRYYDNHFEHLSGTVNYYGAGVARQNYGDPFWSTSSSYANSFGSFLLGIPDSASNQQQVTMANSSRYYAAYVQDDFKVNDRLTLNLGVRWDMDTPMSERFNNLFGYDEDATSPYTIPSGWSWAGALSQAGLSAAQISSLPAPEWARSGKLPNGAGFFVKSAGHDGRLAQEYHPWHFAPRLGLAYRFAPNTVVRASWGMSYITTTGDYWAGWVSGSDSVSSSVWDRSATNGNVDHSNMSMFYPSQYIKFTPTNAELNRNLANYGRLWSTKTDMPREYNYGVSLQHQFRSLLFEAGWTGNHSSTLLATDKNSVFPVSMIDPKYTTLLQTMVDNPLAGQVPDTDIYTHSQVPVGALLRSNPVFGGYSVSGLNIGRSNYNALNVRVEKRLSRGVAFLFNYSFSKSLDNVGNLTNDQGTKSSQSYQSVADLYGVSPLDETHRISFYHDIQFPFGKGRRFLGSPGSLGARLLEKAVGGWEYAGTAIYRSGRPVSFVPQTGDSFLNDGLSSLWGQIIANPNNSSFSEAVQTLTSGLQDPAAQTRRFNTSAFVTTAQAGMVVSNIPVIYPWIRHPGATNYDASLMKNFPIRGEHCRLQFRVEAQNLFNIRGFGQYNTNYDSSTFGLITASALNPRKLQISGRIFF
jgi:hypothetical protein